MVEIQDGEKEGRKITYEREAQEWTNGGRATCRFLF
jgi:hypothetical protein